MISNTLLKWRIPTLAAAVLPILMGLQGCVIGFTNAEKKLDGAFRRIHVPSVQDSSTKGGNAGPLSAALRRRLALDTRFELVALEEARWALDVEVKRRDNFVARIDQCSTTQPRVASASVDCATKSFNQADASSEEEFLQMMVVARAVDLNNGKLVFERNFTLRSPNFLVVGDDATRANMSDKRPLHALRYMENVDQAVEQIADSLAVQLTDEMSGLSPSL